MGPSVRFLLAAVLLHAAALAAAARAPALGGPVDRFREPVRSIEVEVLPSAPVPETAPAPVPEVPSTPAPAMDAAPRVARSAAPAPATTEPPAEEPPPSPSSTAGRDRFDPLPDDRGAILGLPGGPAGWSMPGVLPGGASGAAPAPTAAPAPRAPDRDVAGRLLRAELQQRDKKIGIDLPAAGAVASAVTTAVHASAAPLVARARFSVRLDASGKVRDVRVVSMTDGDAAAWQRVAQAAAAQLAGRKLELTGAYAGGAVVTVEVTSVSQLPAGKKSDQAKKLLGESGGPVAVDAESGVLSLTVRFDVSNIGAHPQRVVTTRFSVQPAP